MAEWISDVRYLLARGKAAAFKQLRGAAPQGLQWTSLQDGEELRCLFREELDVYGGNRTEQLSDRRARERFTIENAQYRFQSNRIETVRGAVMVEPGHSLVFVPGRRVLESSRGVHPEIDPVAPEPPRGADVIAVDALIHFDGFLGQNLWHLFEDSLNPLLWLRESGRADRSLPVLIHRRLYDRPHVQYWVGRPELSDIHWLVQEEGQWVRAAEVIKAGAAHTLFRRVYAMLDEGAAKRPHRRIFLDRRPRYRRRLENDAEILPLLEKSGFERMFAEDLSYDQQIALFRDTKYLVALHGAGLTNMLHSDASELRVLEILTQSYIKPHYYLLSEGLGMPFYDALIGSPLNWRGNYRLDPAVLQEGLDRMLAS